MRTNVIPSGGEYNALKRTKVNYNFVNVYQVNFKFKIVILMFLGSGVKFGGQTSKNVYDVRKVCLRECLCILVCLCEFYVFVLI